MKNKIADVFACVAAAICIAMFSAAFLPIREENIYDSVIRLHVIANSDNDGDQSVKLEVRDVILQKADELFDGADFEQAEKIAEDRLELLKQIADDVLREKGFDYQSSVTLDYENFPTRNYGEASLPGGRYLSLCVRLGEADGKNWWCVMFPPMCNGAAKSVKRLDNCGDVLTFTAKSQRRFKFKFFLLELFN